MGGGPPPPAPRGGPARPALRGPPPGNQRYPLEAEYRLPLARRARRVWPLAHLPRPVPPLAAPGPLGADRAGLAPSLRARRGIVQTAADVPLCRTGADL